MKLPLWKVNLFVKLFGLAKIPLVFFCGPKFVEFDQNRCVVKIKLGYRTKNHLNSMYFGALAVGAELSVAAAAVFAIQQKKQRIDFLFKDFQCQFLKRAEGDVLFVCEEVPLVSELIEKASNSSERLETTLKGYAYVPSKGKEPVISYQLTLSVKNRQSKS